MDFLHARKLKRGYGVFTHPHSFFSLKIQMLQQMKFCLILLSAESMARCPQQALSQQPEVNFTDKHPNSTDFERDLGI